MPKVSVIIPTYNRAKYIAETIDSVLKQTFSDFEIIVVNDGSTDNTEETIKEQFEDKVIYLYKPNGGPASARNMGISVAKGEYIAFLESDDLWFPEKLEIQTRFMDANPEIGLTGSRALMFKESAIGELEDQALLVHKDTPTLKCLLQDNRLLLLTVMVRKTCLDDIAGFDEDKTMMGREDYELWLRIAVKYKIVNLPRVLARYRSHRENLFWGNSAWENAQAYFAVIKRVDEKIPGLITDCFGDEKLFYADRYRSFGDKIPFRGDLKEKIKFYKESLKLNKANFRIVLKLFCCYLIDLKN